MRHSTCAALLVACVALSGCAPKKSERGSAPIEGYNHTSAAINWFMVNRNGGPNIGPYGGGGKQNCCIGLPRKWHPGLTVLVEWEKDPNARTSRDWPPLGTDDYRAAYALHAAQYTRHSATVEVAPYEKLGVLDVHFLPCDQIAVSAVAQLPGQPGYPFNYPSKMEVPAVCPKP
jgi:hypothetical protein